jgi:AAA domain
LIIHINSYPGVGKLTIGRHLAELLNGKLLDNHSIYNVAFAVTEFRTPAFYQTVRAVRDIAYARLLRDSAWGTENWDEVIALARRRVCALLVVILTCSTEENARRIQDEERASKRKPRNFEMISANSAGRPLLDHGGNALLRLDVTGLSAETAAESIAEWVGRMTVAA